MRKILVIALREYNGAVRTKAFLVSVIILPIMMVGSIGVQMFLLDRVDTTEKRFAIVDRTPGEVVWQAVDEAVKVRNQREIFSKEDPPKQVKPTFGLESIPAGADDGESAANLRYELSERVRKGEFFGFVEIGADVLKAEAMPPEEAVTASAVPAAEAGASKEPTPESSTAAAAFDRQSVRYHSNSPTYDDFRNWLEPVINATARAVRFKAKGLDRVEVELAMRNIPLLQKGLSEKQVATGKIEEGADENVKASVFVAFGVMMLMFMVIMVTTTPLMQGVVEEKMQRIAEVLLGSVRPFDLMLGKLLGMTGVSLTLATLYMIGGYWAADYYGFSQYLPLSLLPWFIVFQIMAVLMYGAIFVAVGAACSDIRETQTLVTPVMLVVTAPMFVLGKIIQEPNGGFSTIASLFPPATPMLMTLRLAVPPGVPLWQPLLGVALVLLTTMGIVFAAGRIFRVGILMQGKGASFKDLAKWVLQ